jgi:hypothetical protein
MEAAIGTKRDEGKARRLRLEHAQILTMGDLHRAVDLGGACWFYRLSGVAPMRGTGQGQGRGSDWQGTIEEGRGGRAR